MKLLFAALLLALPLAVPAAAEPAFEVVGDYAFALTPENFSI